MKTIFKFGTVVVSLFIATLTCIARDVSKEQFLKALFKGKEFPVTLTQSPTYPWKYDSNSVKATSRQEDVNSDCWFALDIYVPKDSASVSFDYQVRYHKEAHGWAKYATLSCQIDGKEVFGNNGTDKMESATIKIGKGFHTLKWNLKLGEAWENWDYFGAIENMSFEGISDKCALPEYSKTSSSTWCLPFAVRTDTIVIENLGKEGFEISSLDGLTAPFYLKSSPSIIPPGKSDAILVGYAPQEEGCHEQTLTLLSNWGKKTIPYHGMSYGVEPICNSSPGKLSESVKNYNVESATIFGPMNRTDNYTLNKFKKLKHLDLRGTDMKYIFNGGINNLYLLEDILLPSSLKYIDATWISKHWDSASKKEVYYNIKTITCMSPEPPKIVYLGGGNEEYEFNGLKSDVIIYVPARYLAYYEADAKWNKFKIMPIMNDSKSLHIKFDSSKLPDYSGCSIELMEERSQQTQRLTVGNTVDYVFHNLKPEKSYTLNLIHPSKRILAAKDSVTVGESNETVVQFDSIEPLYKATLQVVGTDNINLTDKVQGHWITPHENDRTGTEITQLMEGDTIKCIVSLPKEIGKRYQIPDTVYHIVNTANNTLEINLFPHKKSTVKGIVLNIDNEPIQSASISARQTLNGNLPWNSTLKTDTDGRFELEAYEGVIALDISADKYFSTQRTDTISGIVNLGELRLLKCEGREIRLNVTFRENDIVGKEGYVSAGYDRWKDLVFTVFDSNSRNEIKNVKVEYPRIYLLDEITGHSSFTLKVSSRNKAFEDFEVNCESIDAGNFTAEIQIVEHGDIRATYNQAYTDEVLALLYDKNGNIRQSSDFVNNGVSLKGIPDGKYTLVAIESDELYGTVPNLSDLRKFGLVNGESYNSAAIEVVSGTITEVVFDNIPALAQQNRIASDKSYMTPNRSRIVAGNYLTVKSAIELKPEYHGKTGNLSLNIIIPDSCQFVPNSLLIGSDLGAYNYDGHTVVIPIQEGSEPVRFCITPMRGGYTNVSAYISYDLEGNTFNESIGGFSVDVTGVSLNVLPTVPNHRINVSGTGIANSDVEIIGDNILLGRTTVLANGNWQTTVDLCDSRDLKTHNLHSRLTTPDGNILYSETKSVRVNTETPYVQKVEMFNSTPTGYTTVFDFSNPFAQKKSYSYNPSYPTFTFKVYFTNASEPTSFSDAVLWVKTTDGKDIPIELVASPTDPNIMIGTHAFPSSYSLPSNVAVSMNYIDDSALKPEYALDILYECIPSFSIKNIMKDGDRAVSYELTSTRGNFSLLCCGVNYIAGDDMDQSLRNIVSRFEFDSIPGNSSYLISPSNGVLMRKEMDGKTTALLMYDATTRDEYRDVLSMLSKRLNPIQTRVQVDPNTGYLVPNRSSFTLSNKIDQGMQDLIDICNKKLACVEKMGEPDRAYAADDMKASLNAIVGMNLAMAATIISGTHEIAGSLPQNSNIITDLQDLEETSGNIEDVRTAMEGISKATERAMKNLTRYPTECGLSSSPNYVGTGVTPLIDPSGYVYEAVESNRLEGVKTTAYHKTETTDDTGNVVENITVWDATMYEQSNPLYTDADGRYAWDVPAGLWQVKYEKSGYETITSDWLPVPPPQMDVNVGMTQLINPVVTAAAAFPDSVCFSFSKYMDVNLLTFENISIKKGDTVVEGALELVNAESCGDKTLSSKVHFVPNTPLNAGDAVVLSVSAKVKSYAGCQLLGDYSQVLVVAQPIQIEMEDRIDIKLGEAVPLKIHISPNEEAIGKSIRIKVSNESIASVDRQTIEIDNAEQPVLVNVTGLLPGNAMLSVEMDGVEAKSTLEIQVVSNLMRQAYAPWATIATGTTLDKGTKVYLFSATPNATIYYTTDGSCPCDIQTRKKYIPEEGITINNDVSIHALAVAEGLLESESIELNYTVNNQSGMDDIRPENDILFENRDGNVFVYFNENRGKALVEIFNIQGTMIIKRRISSGDAISLGNAPSGIYIVSANVAGKRVAKKIIKLF